ncbi:MAG: hypothetical protein KatS3mg053_2665 [Candidatus Roseilinea sp.]|nr:MAG: hypothetical protein KatS3mg053_2665 [Candidatus Roseilinea sp.]
MSKPARPFIGVVIAVIAASMLSACGPQPTPVPTIPPVVPTTPANDDLARVRAAGKLRVGTSGDYPPFAFYSPSNYQLDGLDIALMREIGRRLGVQVEFSDFAFEGILDAMRLGQVDAAVAALSVTDARRQVADFTNFYYISQDGIIALSDSPVVAVRSVEDIAGRRVGAQRGSVYETWLRQRLVDTGLMSPNELLLYARLDDAVRDLNNRRIDLLVADLAPMQSIVNTSRGQYKLVGQRLNVQQLAVATRKGSTLLGALDQALMQMQADGTLNRLIAQYLGVPPEQITPIPTATPGPPSIIIVTEPAPACIDGMAFVADLTYDDQNMANPPILQPGQPFRKGWRVRNSGSCTWTTAYTFSFDGGNSPLAQMGGQTQVIAQPVVPGQTVDFYVDLVAPTVPGIYQGFWRMRNDRGVGFGTRVYVGIRVPQPVIPTQTPLPGVSFSANPTQISPGQPVVFTWNAQGARAAYFYPQGQLWSQYPVPTTGQQTAYPQATTVYELRVVKFDGSIEIRQIVIQVNQQPGAPVIQEFTTIPQNQVTLGQPVALRWNVQGQVNRVRLLRNNAVILDNAPVVGTMQDYPQVAGQNTFTLEAYGAGVTRASRVLNVISSGLPGPTIIAFVVTPESIPVGACVTIRWEVSGNATSIRITRNGQPIVASSGPSGALQDCLAERGFYGYRLEALGPAGQPAVRERAVTVYR